MGGMMLKRFAGWVARHREDWPSFQAARHSVRDFWASPSGPLLSVRMPSARRRNRQPVCLRRRTCGLQTDSNGDADV